ncbi:CTD kinase subunit gamma CTK3-domain-containing protein [Radiomyces spectabilis]|uniref:CTD kinase subunit gamma CTK3-domain-containing protein n=1 Tax=Radiomyces spectabilis TaxID=64574 RepID=UPI0022203D42|nr:CTD kinase subunit gamma CTK3-domain-containing protein [Radiomyces spectabilis]KAI8391183.1 CTD kinase subunit gamma CTK3-domain-containing protein [Radiomyces spectabilis]
MAEDTDPFECRLIFSDLLQKLNASQQSIHKVANYAMRHRRSSEDLYNCLREELDQASLNARLNLLYVLDAILSVSQKSRFKGYIELTRRDFIPIVRAVVLNDAKGVVNLPNTRKILNNWKRKAIFEPAAFEEVDRLLSESDASSAQTASSSDGFTKEDILRRMEEDRERHKRLREEIWIRPSDESADAEFEQIWESTQALDPETDYETMMVQNMLRLPQYAWHMMLSQRTSKTNQNDDTSCTS